MLVEAGPATIARDEDRHCVDVTVRWHFDQRKVAEVTRHDGQIRRRALTESLVCRAYERDTLVLSEISARVAGSDDELRRGYRCDEVAHTVEAAGGIIGGAQYDPSGFESRCRRELDAGYVGHLRSMQCRSRTQRLVELQAGTEVYGQRAAEDSLRGLHEHGISEGCALPRSDQHRNAVTRKLVVSLDEVREILEIAI